MQEGIVEGAVYRHYKQALYRVHALAVHTETLEKQVVYEALYENPVSRWWIRPLSMFLENVTTEHGVVPRFSLVTER